MRITRIAAIFTTACLTLGLQAATFLKTGDVIPSTLESPHPVTGVWRTDVSHPDASALRLHVADLQLGAGDRLVLLDGNGVEAAAMEGPFQGALWLPFTEGDRATLEIQAARGSEPWGLRLDWLDYEYPTAPQEGAVAPESICNQDDSKDAVCYQSDNGKWTAGSAVARFRFSDPANGSGYCTGFLASVNGHFLTNNHCIATETGAQSVVFNWLYQNTACGGSTLGTYDTKYGAHLVVTDPALDYALLVIADDTPQARYGYLTLNPNLPSVGDTLWIAGHPQAWPKRFSVYSDLDGGDAKVQAKGLTGGNGVVDGGPTDLGYYADTQAGSSGSPVMAADNSVIAIHHFGISGSTCTPSDMNQGVEMAKVYPQIASYLSQPYFSVTASAVPTAGPAPLAVTFSAEVAGGASPFTYSWDFGDGSAASTIAAPQHTFANAGTYKVTLTVNDSASRTATDGHLSISATADAPLTATASSDKSSGNAPLSVQFSGTASGGTPPYSFSWIFGDGSAQSTAQNPLHTYASAGTYNAVLTVRDGAGATATDNRLSITASNPSVPPPVISSVQKATSPFRLILSGSNFRADCTVYIDGVAVPTTTFRSSVKVVAKNGAPLKAMVPRGQAVSITVVNNDDGGISLPFNYTRPAAVPAPAGDAAPMSVPDSPKGSLAAFLE